MKTNDYQPPLTAEDVVDNFIRTPESIRSWCQLVCDIKALIIQQTATKDARIAELKAELECAEQFADDFYTAVVGEPPEWSEVFAYKDSLSRIYPKP